MEMYKTRNEMVTSECRCIMLMTDVDAWQRTNVDEDVLFRLEKEDVGKYQDIDTAGARRWHHASLSRILEVSPRTNSDPSPVHCT